MPSSEHRESKHSFSRFDPGSVSQRIHRFRSSSSRRSARPHASRTPCLLCSAGRAAGAKGAATKRDLSPPASHARDAPLSPRRQRRYAFIARTCRRAVRCGAAYRRNGAERQPPASRIHFPNAVGNCRCQAGRQPAPGSGRSGPRRSAALLRSWPMRPREAAVLRLGCAGDSRLGDARVQQGRIYIWPRP